MIVLPHCLRLQPCRQFWKVTTHRPPSSHKPGPMPGASAPLLRTYPCLVEGEAPPQQQMQQMQRSYSWPQPMHPNNSPHKKTKAWPPLPKGPMEREGVDQRGSSLTPDQQQRQPACMDWCQSAVVVVCCPPWMRVTIRDWHFFGREEEDKDNDGNGLQERDNYERTMMTTNNCSGRGRCNAKGWWNRNIDMCNWSCEEILEIALLKMIQVSLFGWNQVLLSYIS